MEVELGASTYAKLSRNVRQRDYTVILQAPDEPLVVDRRDANV